MEHSQIDAIYEPMWCKPQSDDPIDTPRMCLFGHELRVETKSCGGCECFWVMNCGRCPPSTTYQVWKCDQCLQDKVCKKCHEDTIDASSISPVCIKCHNNGKYELEGIWRFDDGLITKCRSQGCQNEVILRLSPTRGSLRTSCTSCWDKAEAEVIRYNREYIEMRRLYQEELDAWIVANPWPSDGHEYCLHEFGPRKWEISRWKNTCRYCNKRYFAPYEDTICDDCIKDGRNPHVRWHNGYKQIYRMANKRRAWRRATNERNDYVCGA